MDRFLKGVQWLVIGLYMTMVVFSIVGLAFNAYTTVPESLVLSTSGLKTARELRLEQTIVRYQDQPAELLNRAKRAAEAQKQTVKYLHQEAHSLPQPITVEKYKAKMIGYYEFHCKEELQAINQQIATFHRTGKVHIEYLSTNMLNLEAQTRETRRLATRIRARHIAYRSALPTTSRV